MARGGTDWYFLTVNFALGQGIEGEATKYIESHGGKVLDVAFSPDGLRLATAGRRSYGPPPISALNP